jgi:hypothetical protein
MDESLTFSYHDNRVTILALGYETTTGGGFTVTDFSITPNQDPEDRNFKGMLVPLDSEFDLTFVVGRKASGTVADFYNATIKSFENTFNHGAGELNFAFLGTLQLNVQGGKVGSATTLTFDNVCLAQGHSGATNNWWFGIQGGQFQDNGDQSVRTQDAGGQWVVDFFRSQSVTDVDTIGYKVIQPVS